MISRAKLEEYVELENEAAFCPTTAFLLLNILRAKLESCPSWHWSAHLQGSKQEYNFVILFSLYRKCLASVLQRRDHHPKQARGQERKPLADGSCPYTRAS